MNSSNPCCEHLLIGISGSFNSTGMHMYLNEFRQRFAGTIRIIMTKSATRMVQPQTLELYSDSHVFVDFWDQSNEIRTPHMQLAQWADLFLVAPATADIIGKAANGIADDLLSTTIASHRKPIVFAPAMNPDMFAGAAVQRNLERLRADGHMVLDPAEGTSISTGRWDRALTIPSVDEILIRMRQRHFKTLQQAYWQEATAEPARTPAQQKLLQLQQRREALEGVVP